MSNYDKVRERLAKYRLQKVTTASPTTDNDSINQDVTPPLEEERKIDKTSWQQTEDNSAENSTEFEATSNKCDWISFSLKCLLWCLLQALFIEIEFGIIFFIASCLFFMVASLRGSKRKANELSAYSVFNKNFERIEGTLTAEQFDKEIRHGPASVH